MSDDFPECDFFCLRAGRVSVFPSNCGTTDLFESIARDCSCAESPVAKGATCLQRFCAPADFAALEAAEEARCPGLVPGGAAAGGLSRRALPSPSGESGAVLGNLTSAAVHVQGGCGGGVASPVVFVPLALVVFAVVAAVGAYRRRRCAEARISLGSEREDAEDVEDVRVKVGEKGRSGVA
ncbi:uncharacterized protein TRAVEDRAFT_51570 [Trametes versicolor FP-101664 SS1]|uniref:uncharacterized protein n=1 Tax=Trametes versicolor (strain FP-101664) TaxID=717944 RepID=UPI0004623B94|nr:uncharacterized protein TRAVEDRAFT_51570 [Trametes versicolor FP-101664 SS1]EIW53830.1 hypothetical protein TRAVEDRAFT_51570 [Trametes versicolor FP-101664 SS1]